MHQNVCAFFLRLIFVFVIPAMLFPSRGAELEPQIVERGWHHRVWQRITPITQRDGQPGFKTNSYTEMASGMHYQQNGQWLESREEVEIVNGQAVAQKGQHQATFAAHLDTAGAITLTLPHNGPTLRSHPIGLFYTDAASGQSVILATIKSSAGAVLPPNQVVYPDALDGDCIGDMHYRYTRNGFEQDLLILAAPPSPTLYGLNPETTRLELVTEFVDPPEPVITRISLKPRENAEQMIEPDLTDDLLDFGTMKFVTGQAFPSGTTDPFDEPTALTGKEWKVLNGRHFLVEKVDYVDIRSHLQTLPQAENKKNQGVGERAAGQARLAKLLPPAPRGVPGTWRRDQWANVDKPKRGLVIDYSTINGTLTNQLFAADTTTLIGGLVQLYGSNVIEGGAVIKFTNGSNRSIEIFGTIECRTSQYHPATFTSKDDDSIGTIISGSTGTPVNRYANHNLYLKGGTTNDIHDLHIRHATYGVTLSSNVKAILSHIQVQKVDRGVAWLSSATLWARNILMADALNVFYPAGYCTSIVEHATFHRAGNFLAFTSWTNEMVRVTNSLFVCVTNNLIFRSGTDVVTNWDDTTFQSIGGAARYLATNSAHRGIGLNTITPSLLTDLKTRTTYPPTVISNDIVVNTILFPTAPRQTGSFPDIGYAYDPLDWALSKITLSNATLTVKSGTAVGVYGSDYGLQLSSNATLTCEGTPASLCRLVRYNLVQEQATTNWSASSVGPTIESPEDNIDFAPKASFRFTDWAMPASGNDHFRGNFATFMPLSKFKDCQFLNGSFYSSYPSVAFTNCLFIRSAFELSAQTVNFHNCLFYGGELFIDDGGGIAKLTDNLFDKTTITQTGTNNITHSHNGYVTNYNRLTPTGTVDVVLTSTNIPYEVGPLGSFYLPSSSSLINTGSVSAASATLYYFVTTTNQVKEGSSTVDIGFHYAVLDSSLNALDTDLDGVPDYIEDTDGDGVADTGETDVYSPDVWRLKVLITRPRSGSVIP